MLSNRCISLDRCVPVVAGFREAAGATEVWLCGEIDLASSQAMVEELGPLFGRDSRAIRVDLSAVTFLDARGIGSCLSLQQRARAGGRDLVFANPRGIVARVIHLLGLESVLLGAQPRG